MVLNNLQWLIFHKTQSKQTKFGRHITYTCYLLVYYGIIFCYYRKKFSCFSSHFCFLDFRFFVFLFVLKLIKFILQFLAAVISLFTQFFDSLNCYIYTILNTGESFSSFFSYNLSIPSLGRKALCVIINFFFFLFFGSSI